MEKRVLFAIVLSMTVFIVYFNWILPLFYPPPGARKRGPVPKDPIVRVPLIDELPQGPKFEATRHTLQTPRLSVTFSNVGGTIESLILKDFKKEDKISNLELIKVFDPNRRPLGIKILSDPPIDLGNLEWEMRVSQNSVECVYPGSRHAPGEFEIRKLISLGTIEHTIDLRLIISNRSNLPLNLSFELWTIPGLGHDSPYRYDSYTQSTIGCRGSRWWIEYLWLSEIAEGARSIPRGEEMIWQGIKNRYFCVVFMPKTPQDLSLIGAYNFYPLLPGAKDGNLKNILCSIKTPEIRIEPGVDRVYDFVIYAGPIRYQDLEAVGNGLPLLLDFSGFDFIGALIQAILIFFYNIFHNYGVAIIMTTIAVRVLLFPLTKKGQVSAYKMQKLQPRLAALRQAYKNDKQRFAAEQMKLFKEHGVNPLSGCLTLLLQLPIFIGMYSVFDISIEVRQAPFLLWIQDLSQPDRFATLPFSILGTKDLNLLPILMTLTWITQAMLAPKSPDPQAQTQQKVFLFMLPVFGIIVYSFASGLSLYFLVNSGLGIIEQRLIKKLYLSKI
jgi:YidC/Oxa1 family membrane protein insertase